MVLSVHEITLSERQHFCRFAGKEPAIGPHFIGLRIDLHAGGRAVQHHGTLADLAGVPDGKKLFRKSKLLPLLYESLADECDGAFCHTAAKRTKHRTVILWLWVRNRTVGVSHDCGSNDAALQHHVRLHTEKGRVPNTEIGEFPDFDRADIIGNALSDRGIDRVFRDITPRPEIVVVTLLFRQPPELFLHFIGRLPSTDDDFAYPAHRLTVR